MKFYRLTQYYKRILSSKISASSVARKLVPGPFIEKKEPEEVCMLISTYFDTFAVAYSI